MGRLNIMLLLYFVTVLLHIALPTSAMSRQKRCIVIQKQSGTHGDSSEGDGGDDREVEPRKPEKRGDDRYNRRNAEKMPSDSEFLRYRISPSKKLGVDDVLRYKNKLMSMKNRFL